MSKIYLNGMRVKGETFAHYINTETDGTTLEDNSNEVRFTVNSDAVLFDRAGKLGNFLTGNDNLWYFSCLSGLVIETGNKDLIKAEMKVFKHFLEL